MNAAALEPSPPIRRSNAGRPGVADAPVAFRLPRLRRCPGVPMIRCCPWLRALGLWPRAARHRQPGTTISCRLSFSATVFGRGHTLSAQHSLAVCEKYSPIHPPGILCTSYTVKSLSCDRWSNDSTPSVINFAREPFPLCGSLRAVILAAVHRWRSLPKDSYRNMKHSCQATGDRHADKQ
jgi:hypothetical protein